MDFSKLSSYQDPQGSLKERRPLPPRTDMRKAMFDFPGLCAKRTVLDLGCNNGYFVREALKAGARRAVGVDYSDCIQGARELAKEEGVPQAEFWQTSLESPEFKKYCPRFEVVFLLSVLTHMKDREGFLDWLDDKVTYTLVFESNHGEKNKAHIDLITKHMYFESVEFLGRSDIDSKPHYLWVCRKAKHEIRYSMISGQPVEWIPINKIIGWSVETILNQKTKYDLNSEKFNKLKEDIRKRGIRDPLVLEDEKDGYFKGFQGGHRYLAAKQLGYTDVPCRVMRGFDFKHLNKDDE